MTERVLLVEDDDAIRYGIRRFLEKNGYVVAEAVNCQAARQRFSEFHPTIVVTDFRLPDGEAFEFFSEFRRGNPTLPILVLTGYGTIELAVRAVKQGADNVLTKPIGMASLLDELRRTLIPRQAKVSGTHRITRPSFGQSATMAELREHVNRLRDVDCSTLILGETGTGKTMLARWLHESGRRASKPFVDLNCAGLARDLVESELFGHEKGSFTSAHATKEGMLEAADGGTLFLDEIGDIDMVVQPKLLKAIEEKRFRRMGGTRERTVDTRIIAATHRDLREASRMQTFRADLYYRLSTVTITIPPLRARAADIPNIARELLATLAAPLGREPPELASDAERALVAHSWPGNIRELRNVLERALHLGTSDVLHENDLLLENDDEIYSPSSTTITPSSSSRIPVVGSTASNEASNAASATLQELERVHIERALAEHGHVAEAARSLGISRSTMYQKLKLYRIAMPSTLPTRLRTARVSGT